MSEAIGADDWAGEMGERWLANVDAYESMLATVGEASLAHAAFRPGERVIDIGCGGGWTTREIARAVGPTGGALGLDISEPLIAEARRRAAGLAGINVGFVALDAATAQPPGAPWDRLHSRFGSMFFADAKRAFANLRAMLRTDARADFTVWAPLADNAWVAEALAIVRRHVDMPRPPPRAPGPFAFDDPAWFDEVLRAAGFRDPRFERWDGLQCVGGAGLDAERATDFVLANTHFADALCAAPETAQAAARREIVTVFARHARPEGIALRASAWFVAATAGPPR